MKSKKTLYALLPLLSGIMFSPLVISKSCKNDSIDKKLIEELKNNKIFELVEKDKKIPNKLSDDFSILKNKLNKIMNSKHVSQDEFNKINNELNSLINTYKKDRAKNFFNEIKSEIFNLLENTSKYFLSNEDWIKDYVKKSSNFVYWKLALQENIKKQLFHLNNLSLEEDDNNFNNIFAALDVLNSLKTALSKTEETIELSQKYELKLLKDIIFSNDFVENESKITPQLTEKIKHIVNHLEQFKYNNWNNLKLIIIGSYLTMLNEFKKAEVKYANQAKIEKTKNIFNEEEVQKQIKALREVFPSVEFTTLENIINDLKKGNLGANNLETFYEKLISIYEKVIKMKIKEYLNEVFDNNKGKDLLEFIDSNEKSKTLKEKTLSFLKDENSYLNQKLETIYEFLDHAYELSTFDYFEYLRNYLRESLSDREFWNLIINNYSDEKEIIDIVSDVKEFKENAEKYLTTYFINDLEDKTNGITYYVDTIKKLKNSPIISKILERYEFISAFNDAKKDVLKEVDEAFKGYELTLKNKVSNPDIIDKELPKLIDGQKKLYEKVFSSFQEQMLNIHFLKKDYPFIANSLKQFSLFINKMTMKMLIAAVSSDSKKEGLEFLQDVLNEKLLTEIRDELVNFFNQNKDAFVKAYEAIFNTYLDNKVLKEGNVTKIKDVIDVSIKYFATEVPKLVDKISQNFPTHLTISNFDTLQLELAPIMKLFDDLWAGQWNEITKIYDSSTNEYNLINQEFDKSRLPIIEATKSLASQFATLGNIYITFVNNVWKGK